MNCPRCGHYFETLQQMKRHKHCRQCELEGKSGFFANATAYNQHMREVHKWEGE